MAEFEMAPNATESGFQLGSAGPTGSANPEHGIRTLANNSTATEHTEPNVFLYLEYNDVPDTTKLDMLLGVDEHWKALTD